MILPQLQYTSIAVCGQRPFLVFSVRADVNSDPSTPATVLTSSGEAAMFAREAAKFAREERENPRPTKTAMQRRQLENLS